MHDFLVSHFVWIKAFHVIAVISWMAGMLYLPRLFVYHADAEKGSELSETFKIMERKLLRLIINPAMLATWLFGLLMIYATPSLLDEKWLHAKLGLVILMQIFHAFLSRWRKAFLRDGNAHPAKFFRYMNEIPAALMAVIVVLVIVKPF